MAVARPSLITILRTLPDDELAVWISRFCTRDLPDAPDVPHDVDERTYLLGILDVVDPGTRHRIAEALLGWLDKKVLHDNAPIGEDVENLLRVLAVCPPPTSDRTTVLITELLERTRDTTEFAHRQALLCLAGMTKSLKPGEDWSVRLQKDLEDPSFAVAALSALVAHQPMSAAMALPRVLDLLAGSGIAADLLLRRIARVGKENAEFWQAVSRYVPARLVKG